MSDQGDEENAYEYETESELGESDEKGKKQEF
jgi:hypothetical protein